MWHHTKRQNETHLTMARITCAHHCCQSDSLLAVCFLVSQVSFVKSYPSTNFKTCFSALHGAHFTRRAPETVILYTVVYLSFILYAVMCTMWNTSCLTTQRTHRSLQYMDFLSLQYISNMFVATVCEPFLLENLPLSHGITPCWLSCFLHKTFGMD